jgi:hypothetical protein
MSRITAPLQDLVEQKDALALAQRLSIKSPRYPKGGMVDVAVHELGAEVVEVKVLKDEKVTGKG